MTLDEFKAKTERALQSFRQFWLGMNDAQDDSYPLEMGEGDWFEQFLSHLERMDKET